ncbi:STAS domain-containing protein [Umezakia ovalisporum]|jgi:anti-anti-sigma factor|uniref:Anti-sigma factor antagonist n=2 Tax=Umezakia ovalisporum TaxID=75695 RepID=A0AA43KFG7_9CYAN|nr:STAS domain-containing protein [Umezakia ovalisporum]MBI1242543.1 anti-sigma factor antagonist [Nostoc sp. RI_552]MDH6057380.1 STAS domain-containing protein [Umezakia ovalisporum FSS-43]MDH6064557.1 STAS domain-containing protein [Umezakia ovalisporum FSS-62]MDH6065892.1 STAS domain-containing protein [Umezakia ovalisporum APH033B]MDH6070770.1 STAS domain-containing protein [Umezakia ovalisporum CobakiLakeA]
MNPEVKVVKLSGIINIPNSQELQQYITQLLESGAKIILVDCQDVSFMDSSGLGSLVLAFKTLREAHTRLVLCSINEQVRILFELTSMDKVFEIFLNQDEFNQVLLSKN